MITITIEEYRDLLASQALLDILKSQGIDNWEGYEEAMEIYNDNMKVENDHAR